MAAPTETEELEEIREKTEESQPAAEQSEEIPVSEVIDYRDPEPPPAPAVRPGGIRPELIMGIIAILAAVLLGLMIVLCLPYLTRNEDPEALQQGREENYITGVILEINPEGEDPDVILKPEDPEAIQETGPDTILEPTVSETEPENPTIPPDRNPYDRYDFQYNANNYLLLQNVHSIPGIDVSAYQGYINWEKVAASGIEFAIVRLGYRGYGTGKLVEDDFARRNLKGAREAGLKVGAYFFSQALSIRETDAEMKFMLKILDGFELDMPIILDWEIPTADARTAKMDARTLTDIQLHFCGNMKKKGFQPMVYFNWHQSETLYYLSELEDYPFWLAMYQDRMTYPWKVEMWQYSDKGTVPGITGAVDLNVYMPN